MPLLVLVLVLVLGLVTGGLAQCPDYTEGYFTAWSQSAGCIWAGEL